MSKNLYRILITLMIVIFIIILFKYFHLRAYLGIAGFNRYSGQILQIHSQHPYTFVVAYFIVYVLLIICCAPGTIALDILAGFLFGVFWGTALIVISYLVGVCCNFIVVHYLLHDFFLKRFKKFKIAISGNNKRELFLNLTSLRLIPIIPFWVLSIIASILKVEFKLFITSAFIGILPIAVIYALIGDGTRSAILSHGQLTVGVLFNPEIWLPLIALSLIMVSPNIFKYIRRITKK